MSSIDISPEALTRIKALAQKATPGPWASYANVEATFGVEPYDWGQVYARVGEHGEHVWAILSVNLHRLSPGEEAEARTAFREGRGFDPGQPGRDAAFIASNPPETVMAYIDEILRLREHLARLEKEADWLAIELAKRGRGCKWMCDQYHNGCIPSFVPCGYKGSDIWREAARKAVEEKETAND